MRNKSNAAQDARLILQLDRLREEDEMRKARRWWSDEFWPRTARATTSKSKWRTAPSKTSGCGKCPPTGEWPLLLFSIARSAKRLFFARNSPAKCSSLFAKVHPFLKQLRDRTNNPEFMANVEQLILNSKEARERLRDASKRINTRTKVA